MKTTSILSEGTSLKTGLYIKSNFKIYKYGINKNAKNLSLEKEEAIVRHISKTPAANQSIPGNHKYTLQHGDEKRLSKDGVLKVYNIMEPIDIPVGKLLGNWKKSHTGVTLIVSNGQWCIEGEEFKQRINKPERGVLVALRILLKLAMA